MLNNAANLKTMTFSILMICALSGTYGFRIGAPKQDDYGCRFNEINNMLGFDFIDDSCSVEQQSRDKSCVDEIVLLKIRTDKKHSIAAQSIITQFPQYRGEIGPHHYPKWWNPTHDATRIAYYTDKASASPVIVIYFDSLADEVVMYIEIISV